MTLIPPTDDPTVPAITPPEPKFWTGRVEVTWSGCEEVEIRPSDQCYSEADMKKVAISVVQDELEFIPDCEYETDVLEITSGP